MLFNYIAVDGLPSFGGSVVKQSNAILSVRERERERGMCYREELNGWCKFQRTKKKSSLIYREN